MREADFGSREDADGEAAVRRALVEMMLESTWSAIRDKDFVSALECPIAVLALEKNTAAAFALGAAALSFLNEVLPWPRLQPLLAAYLSSADQLVSARYEDLEDLVPKQDRLELLSHARAVSELPSADVKGIEKCASRLVPRFDFILDDVKSRMPSGEIISGLMMHPPEISALTEDYSVSSIDPLFREFRKQNVFASYLTHGIGHHVEYRLESLAAESAFPEPEPRQNIASQPLHLNRAQLRLLLILRARLRAARAPRSIVPSYRRGRRR